MARTLVIDDDPVMETVFREFFARRGEGIVESCAFARTDAEALEIIEQGTEFDVAMIAVDREPISGMSLFMQIKDRAFRVPRIALSSGADIASIRQAMNDGAVDFLVKPVAYEDFTATIGRVVETVDRRRRNWQERAAYSALLKEIDIAADIQQRILPTDFPSVDGFEVAASMRPARVMGGDFYDVFEVSDGGVALLVADVCGKGVPAAFYMAVARTLIRSVAITGVAPAECLRQVNELLCDHHIPGMFVSVFYGLIDPESSGMVYANGGHQLPFLADGKGEKPPRPLAGGDGIVLGILSGLEYEEAAVDLEEGDFLYVFTDGVTEAFNDKREAYSEERLAECLRGATSLPAHEIMEVVNRDIKGFVGEADQHDDITSLVVRRR